MNTWVAAPRMRIGSPGAQPMVSVPPGMCTLTGDVARFEAIAATAVAQAPVPQAQGQAGAALPGAQRECRPSRPLATLTLIRSGKAGSCSIARAEARRVSTAVDVSTKNTRCGLPTLTRHRLFERVPTPSAARRCPSDRRAGSRPSRSAARPARPRPRRRPCRAVDDPAAGLDAAWRRSARRRSARHCRSSRPRRRHGSRCAS